MDTLTCLAVARSRDLVVTAVLAFCVLLSCSGLTWDSSLDSPRVGMLCELLSLISP